MNKRKYLNLVFLFLFQVFAVVAMGQITAPSNPGNKPTGSDPPLGGGAPLGGGTFFMIAMAAAYAGKKIVDLKNEEDKTS